MRSDFSKAVREFFFNGKVLQQTNHTFISLIPKADNPTLVKELRPISCCNVFLKVITKILANRVQSVLNVIVSESQGAFVQGRSLLITLRLPLRSSLVMVQKGFLLDVLLRWDLFKAYDTLNWEFIGKSLAYFHFPRKLIELVLECITTPSYSVLINGVPKGFFHGRRGLRQGDPISSYTFVL